jgi:hypothetical protein
VFSQAHEADIRLNEKIRAFVKRMRQRYTILLHQTLRSSFRYGNSCRAGIHVVPLPLARVRCAVQVVWCSTAETYKSTEQPRLVHGVTNHAACVGILIAARERDAESR